MGGSCELTDRGLTFTGSGRIHGIDVDLSEVGELTPGIAAVAALADSPSTLRGVAHLRLHETDRLAALTKELNELGGDVTETADGLHIRPRPCTAGSSTPTRTTGWPPPLRSSAWRSTGWRWRTWPPPPRPCPTSPRCGRTCSTRRPLPPGESEGYRRHAPLRKEPR